MLRWGGLGPFRKSCPPRVAGDLEVGLCLGLEPWVGGRGLQVVAEGVGGHREEEREGLGWNPRSANI